MEMQIDIGKQRKVLLEKHTLKTQQESYLLSNLDGCKIRKYYDYPGHIFCVKDNRFLFMLHPIKETIVVRDILWHTLKKYHNMTSKQINDLIRDILWKYNHLILPSYYKINNFENYSIEMHNPYSFTKLELFIKEKEQHHNIFQLELNL